MPQNHKDRGKDHRRRSERVKCDGKWMVSLDSLFKGEIENLSLFGLFVRTSKDVPVDTSICIQFKPTEISDKGISIISKVIWSRKDRTGEIIGIGVEFADLSKKDKEVISFYIDAMKKEQAGKT